MKTNRKDFYKTILCIGVPVALQNLISASLNMVDTMMIGKLGENAISAVGMANQLFFIFNLICFGICSGGSIFIAQYWGRKDVKNIRAVMGFLLMMVLGCAALFSVISIFFSKSVMAVFRADEQVSILGMEYLKVVGWSYPVTAFTFAYSFSSRSVHRATMPTMVSAVALGVNAALNYILIFGKLGFAPMGVFGAALATVIARVFEFVVILGLIYATDHPLAGSLAEMRAFSKSFIQQYRQTALPVVINELAWSTGMVMYSVAYARIGTSAMAAAQVGSVISNMFFVFSIGLASACGVMLGNKLGEGDTEEAVLYSVKFLKLTFLTGACIGLLIYAATPYILMWFDVSEGLVSSVRKMLIIKAIFSPLITFNSALIVGILRSGGDTKYSLFLEMGSVWGIGVPMAFLGSVVLGFPIDIVVLMTSVEELFKTAVGVPRVLSQKWVKSLV